MQLTPKKKLAIFLGLVLLLHLISTGYGLSRDEDGPGSDFAGGDPPDAKNFSAFKEQLKRDIMAALPSFARAHADSSGDLPKGVLGAELAPALQVLKQEGLTLERLSWRPATENETGVVLDGFLLREGQVALILAPPATGSSTASLRADPPLLSEWLQNMDVATRQAALADLPDPAMATAPVPHVDDAPPLEQDS